MAIITIPTRTSADLNAAADVNALMDNCTDLDGRIVDPQPVGSFYWQPPSAETNTKVTAFPTAEEPGELYGGTWEQRYNDEGLFFKTEGDVLSQTDGEDNVRTTGLQTDAGQGHYHASYYLNATCGGGGAADGMFVRNATAEGTQHTTASSNYARQPIANATDGTPRTGKETRGRNRLMKLWYRTA
jgi:hypothetical protein